MKNNIFKYAPGVLLFIAFSIIGILTYNDYGISWDEPAQREMGTVSYNYIFNGDKTLLTYFNGRYGVGYELVLVCIEKWFKLTDNHDVFLMRHLVTHFFFLVSALCSYFLVMRLFKNNFLACLGFIMFVLCPRIYAHSFFNTKDIIFMCMLTISLCIAQYAFYKNKTYIYVLLGMACGYTTSIRIMGIMLFCFILLFLLIDLLINFINKEKEKQSILKLLVFILGFCCILYLSWPYLWKSPIHLFIYSFEQMSHFSWAGNVLISGAYELSTHMPWTFFPKWFLISNPELWLIFGFAGLLFISVAFLKKPLNFLENTPDRNFLLYFLCFAAPIIAVISLHSVIYDDWRHLFFVYPPFVLAALYFVNKMLQSKLKAIVQAVCVVQIGFISYFMIKNHPFQQVYFNSLVSHKKEFLRKHYEMDYWGCGNKQAFDYLLSIRPKDTLKVSYNPTGVEAPLEYNLLMFKKQDQVRIKLVEPEKCDYFITNFRGHPQDFPYQKIAYSITVLNSTILCVYKVH